MTTLIAFNVIHNDCENAVLLSITGSMSNTDTRFIRSKRWDGQLVEAECCYLANKLTDKPLVENCFNINYQSFFAQD